MIHLSRVDSPSDRNEPTLSEEMVKVGYVAAIGEGILFPDQTEDVPLRRSIRLSQDNLKVLREGKEENGALDEELIKQIVDIMKDSITEIKGASMEEVVEKLKLSAQHILENLHRYKQIERDTHVRLDHSPSLTYTREGRAAISLKGLAKRVGKGTFKLAQFAIIFKITKNGEMSVKKGVSATMEPLTVINRLAADNEKNMMLKLKELGKHPNIINCYSVTDYKKQKSGTPKICFILEYCDQGNLFERVLARKNIPQIIEDILEGLVFLHRNNIFHSDIKPSNILLTGDQLQANIADFGCARNLNDPSQCTYLLGDRSFFSPELKELDQKMSNAIALSSLMEQEMKEWQDALQNYYEAAKVYETAKTIKEKNLGLKEVFEDDEELSHLAQQELDNAISYFEEASKVLHFASIAKEKAEMKVNQKKEILTEKFRRALCLIDESILKSDIYAVGKTFEHLLRYELKRMTPEMNLFLEELLNPHLENRPSAEKALQKFLMLKQEGKIFIPEQEIIGDHNPVLLEELEYSSSEEITQVDLDNYGLPHYGHY